MITSVFDVSKKDGLARSGILHTRAGDVHTPTFMPDATRGAVKSVAPDLIPSTGVEIVLSNTYHLHLQPGEQVIKTLGGLHEFTRRPGPILTDSGGFQVFSLAKINKITEDGVTFKDSKTGDTVFLSPEKSIQIQFDLGADMMVAFDDVVALDAESRGRTLDAFERTHRWLERSLAEFQRLSKDMITPGEHALIQASDGQGAGEQRTELYQEYGEGAAETGTQSGAASTRRVRGSAAKQVGAVNKRVRPLLFGVVQGGLDKDLRKRSLEMVQSLPVDGIAIGGLSVGESREEMHDMLEYLAPLYDNSNRPRFLMGVGDPIDLRFAVEHGIDMLDCVLPTRNARHGTAWVTGDKKIHLTNAKYAEDTEVIDPSCDCTTCKSKYSKGFLRHQFKVGEPLAGTLVSIHNIRYLQRICEEYQSKV